MPYTLPTTILPYYYRCGNGWQKEILMLSGGLSAHYYYSERLSQFKKIQIGFGLEDIL